MARLLSWMIPLMYHWCFHLAAPLPTSSPAAQEIARDMLLSLDALDKLGERQRQLIRAMVRQTPSSRAAKTG
jgi:hypothetical protein